MQVQVSGKHMDVGDALRSRITDELTTSIGKYFERGGAADVTVAQDGHEIRVDCRVHLDSGQNLESHGNAADAHGAFDVALEKIDKRIRRYKRRLKNHHRPSTRGVEVAPAYVLRAPEDEQDGWDDVREEASEGHDLPAGVVIAETETQVKTMTVSMAVLDLDLTQSQTIVFRNAAHGGVSVVYRRPDGNIGWIDPERTKSLNGKGANGSA